MHLAAFTGRCGSCEVFERQRDVTWTLKEYINTKSDDGYTPLHIAASEGYEDIIELLLDNGAKVNIKDNEKRIPVELAIIKSHIPAVKILVNKENLTDEYIDFNILLNTAAKFGRLSSKDLVRLAIKYDNLNAVKCLINKTKEVNERHKIRKTALKLAVIFWAIDALKFLLESNEFIDISKFKFRPYFEFRRTMRRTTQLIEDTNGLFNVVDEQDAISLIENGAFVNAKSSYKGTPLHCAVRTENIAVVDILLKNHANPNSLDWQDLAPLAFVKSREMAEKLLINGAFMIEKLTVTLLMILRSSIYLTLLIHYLKVSDLKSHRNQFSNN
ncbi:hypothetical protein CEXT_607371 [Caerostris extrusa]|uniref:Uncharacterized protein n=1 Tax=Caerostris extrusa TaxID=172846 RepID=A0AAV4V948_CAEEX|nr:hypothetical protein CEXT_607371 [Caerostris extrusa]